MHSKEKIDSLSYILTSALNAVVLLYLMIYTLAQPCAPLISATIFEAFFLVALLMYRRWQANSTQSKKTNQALEQIEKASQNFAKLRVATSIASTTLAAIALAFAAVDVTALVAANAGQYWLSRPLYQLTAPPAWTGLQPAFSMEILAGACIEEHRFEKAESIELENLALRKVLVGDQHELIASSYSDLGDLYQHWNCTDLAEENYLKAIALARKIGYSRGFGKPMTSLACLLRDNRRYEESEQTFLQALTIRRKLFGNNSEKVAETLNGFCDLLQAEGKTTEANSVRQRSETIHAATVARNKDNVMTPLVVSCACIALYSQRDKILGLIARQIQK